MATSTAVPPVTRSTVLRIILISIAVLLAGSIAIAAWIYGSARAALPQVDGQLALAGLSAPVSVVRDAQGVPHIRAATLDDLFFAQGFVTAQDRLWQMDITRRFAAGEMAEVLGPDYLNHDRMQRTLLSRQTAEARAAELPPQTRGYVEAYARGVNAYIAHAKTLPLEFRLLRYAPRLWTVTDSMLVHISMVQMLNLDMVSHAITRERLSARLGPELAADLYPNASWRDRPPSSDEEFTPPDEYQQNEEEEQPAPPRRQRPHPPARRRRARVKMASLSHAPSAYPVSPVSPVSHAVVPVDPMTRWPDDPMTRWPDDPMTRWPDDPLPGSNNWVVSGAHTASGKPLLANDMHLPHQVPNIWYEAHLTAGNFDVAGVTLPGFPFVAAGHNQRIAWGFTNIGPAVSDLFIESFNDRGEYQTPGGWRQPEHRRETIRVRNGRLMTATHEVAVEITITRHGPIVSAIELPSLKSGMPGSEPLDRSRQLALKWTLYEPGSLQNPFFEMNAAQNWDEFRRALQKFASPAQNVVYADVDGHIGYSATGMVPIRACGAAPGCGDLPASGADDTHEWTGYIPFDKLPSAFDPPSGILATANGRITPNDYQYLISNEWGPPYRTERIYRVLSENRKFSAADMLALQTDIYSDFDRFCAQRFVYAVDHAQNASARARQAAELMRTWDGRITADSVAATAVAAARRQLVRLLLEPKIGSEWLDYRWFMSSVWIENLLLRQPARWLPPGYGTFDDLLAAAVDAAVNQPGAPQDLSTWHWGEQQPLNVHHPIFGAIPLLRRWAGPGRFAQSGNGQTVKQVGRSFGPSERLTVDFADLDASTLNIVTGQSGQLFSPHFLDQWRAWYDGHTFALPFSATAVNKAKLHELTLAPAK